MAGMFAKFLVFFILVGMLTSITDSYWEKTRFEAFLRSVITLTVMLSSASFIAMLCCWVLGV